jgi:hypothetical protein
MEGYRADPVFSVPGAVFERFLYPNIPRSIFKIFGAYLGIYAEEICIPLCLELYSE